MARTVAEIMDRDAPSVTVDTGVEEVVRLFQELDIGAVPVVNDGGRCVGIVAEDDLVIADESGDLHIPHYIELFGGLVFLPGQVHHFEERLRRASAATAGDLMTEEPITVAADTPILDAAHLIVEHGYSRLPVVEHGRYVGLVTRADVLAALRQEE